MADENLLGREAQFLIVEARSHTTTPGPYTAANPAYPGAWATVSACQVERIEINDGSRPNMAVISFPDLRWDASSGLGFGDRIRITTDEETPADRTCVFSGFLVNRIAAFAGGQGSGNGVSAGYETNRWIAYDHRWLLSTGTAITGQVVRGPGDYDDYFTGDEAPKTPNETTRQWYTFLDGRRCVFNADGRPNKDTTDLSTYVDGGAGDYSLPIFAAREKDAEAWTVLDMLGYVTGWHNTVEHYFSFGDVLNNAYLTGADMAVVLNNVAVDGLDVLAAVDHILRQIGWSFREQYAYDGSPSLAYYKLNTAADAVRSTTYPTIRHELYAPEAGENIAAAVAAGSIMVHAAEMSSDISHVVNYAIGLGSPHRFEFTAELVPAWLDSDLVPDTEGDVYLTEADLQSDDDPDSYDYYSKYHTKGSSFKWDVGRRWALNESGLYTGGSYDRGMPFAFEDVVPAGYIESGGKVIYAAFKRQLLPCLTLDRSSPDWSANSVGIKVEFSLDGGTTWEILEGAIAALDDECGIYIQEPNLAEMLPKTEAAISGGTLDGTELNYWTSLSDDKLESRSFKDGEWNTRVRVTASVQLDQRLSASASPTTNLVSPFEHRQVYDYRNGYRLQERTSSSTYYSGSLAADDQDDSTAFDAHLDEIRTANEDLAVSGQFVLERLWLATFACGDVVERIAGREVELGVSYGGGERTVWPEIIQILILPQKQQMTLITRDLRFAVVAEPGL